VLVSVYFFRVGRLLLVIAGGKFLWFFLSLFTHADMQDVDVTVCVCVCVCLFLFFVFCTVTDFSAEDKASGVRNCMRVL